MNEPSPLGLSSRDKSRMDDVQRLSASGPAGVDSLVALLSEPSWVIRRAVVTALARIGTPSVAALCAVLAENRTNEARLAAAVDALVASGGDVEPAVRALGDTTKDPAVICDVAQILGRRKSRDSISALAAWSADPDDNVAVAALEALGRIGGAGAVEPLLDAIASRNFFRTFAAIGVLGQSGDARGVAPLAELLHEPHYAGEAIGALGHLGHLSGVPPLVALLAHPDLTMVRAAARALTELRTKNVDRFGDPAAFSVTFRATATAASAPRMIAALEGADGGDTIALATVLGWQNHEAGVTTLLALLDGESTVFDAARTALRTMGQDAEPAVRAALKDGDSTRRARLLPLVGARRSMVSELTACLSDPEGTVRAQAADLLGRIGDPAVVPALFALVGDAEARVALAAVAAIQSLGSDQARDAALTHARSTDPRTRRAALRILSYFGYPEGLPVLLEAIADDDERMREAAASGLAMSDDPRAATALVHAASHPIASTRAATLRALGQGAPSEAIVAALLNGLDDADAWVRYYACQSLGRLHVTSATFRVESKLQDPAGQVRVAAVDAIARLGGDRAMAALEQATKSDDPDVRRSALAGLGQIRRPGAFAVLMRAAEAPDPETRLAAVLAVADASAQDSVGVLVIAGSDTDERVRSAAFDALARRPGADATRWLIERLVLETDRAQAITALSQLVDGRIEGILAALENADAQTAPLLVDTLVRMGRPRGYAAAEAALELENVHARRAAAAAIANLGADVARDAMARAATLDADEEVRRLASLGSEAR